MSSGLKVCHISTFPPTQCGIATYAEDLIDSMTHVSATRIRLVHDRTSQEGFERTILIPSKSSYVEAAEYINNSREIDLVSIQHENGIYGGDLVSIQHENGIYGGNFGILVLKLAFLIRKPIVTTFHTVRPRMGLWPQFILRKLSAYSSRVVVLSRDCAETLIDESVPAAKVDVIPHGIPEVDFRMPEACERRKSLNASTVFVSAGHLRPSKGYHLALHALARYRKIDPHFKYLILGTDQPQSGGQSAYRDELRVLISELGLQDNVIHLDTYLSRQEMLEHIIAADIGLVTYTDEQQSGTGILPLFLGCGRPVVATGFAYARSIQKDFQGLLLADAPDPDCIFQKIVRVSSDRKQMTDWMAANYRDTRDWLWSRAGERYKRTFEDALNGHGTPARPSYARTQSPAGKQSEHLTIGYFTSRRNPCIEWFFDSLDRETSGNYQMIRLVVVDFWGDPEGPDSAEYAKHACLMRKAHRVPSGQFYWTPPKPTVWQGKHRHTSQDWFAASNARNTAICLAPDGWIAFVDDLSVLMPGWLEEVRRAMNGTQNRIMLGAYRKVKELLVKDGEVLSYTDHPLGYDNRWPHGSDSGPVECGGEWLYGCSLAAPVEAFLSINGFDESCDGMGFEDCIAGVMLAKKGYVFAYNRRMLTLESEDLHTQVPVMKRIDFGVSPDDKSHAILKMARDGDGWARNHFGPGGLRELRANVLAGAPLPVFSMPRREFFTGRLFAEL